MSDQPPYAPPSRSPPAQATTASSWPSCLQESGAPCNHEHTLYMDQPSHVPSGRSLLARAKPAADRVTCLKGRLVPCISSIRMHAMGKEYSPPGPRDPPGTLGPAKCSCHMQAADGCQTISRPDSSPCPSLSPGVLFSLHFQRFFSIFASGLLMKFSAGSLSFSSLTTLLSHERTRRRRLRRAARQGHAAGAGPGAVQHHSGASAE